MPGKFSRIIYGGSEEIFKTEVQDGTGRTLEKWKCMKRDFPKTLRIINKKFGLNLIIKERKEPQRDEDLDWAL